MTGAASAAPLHATAAATTGSERARLARLARECALAEPGVLGMAPGAGRARLTLGPQGELLHGVVCAAAPAGGYAVSLDLVAAMVPLHPLGERVRERLHTRARAAGLAGALESVSVNFCDVEPADPRT